MNVLLLNCAARLSLSISGIITLIGLTAKIDKVHMGLKNTKIMLLFAQSVAKMPKATDAALVRHQV